MNKLVGSIFRRPVHGSRATPAPNSNYSQPVSWITDDRYSLLMAGMIWILLWFMIVPLDILSTTKASIENMSQPNIVGRTVKFALLGLSVLVALWRLSFANVLLQSTNVYFLSYLGLIFVSTAWSIAPPTTLNRFISIFSVFATALAFGLTSWHQNRFQNVVRSFLTVILCASLVFGILRPDLAIDVNDKSAWHGLTTQKNQFGQLASFSVIFWLHAWLVKQFKTSWAMFGLGISGVSLMLSQSSTSILATVFAVVLMLMICRTAPNIRRFMPYVVTIFAVLTVIYSLAVLKLIPGSDVLLSPVTAMTGKDLTFSNRTEIWGIVSENIARHPYLGAGYGAYWIGPVPWSPSYEFVTRAGYYPTQSHNGYLESVSDLGFIGLLCLLGYCYVYVKQSLQLMKTDRYQAVLFIGLFFQQSLINLSEACWMQINSLSFIIMTIATIALARSLLEQRMRTALGTSTQPVHNGSRSRN